MEDYSKKAYENTLNERDTTGIEDTSNNDFNRNVSETGGNDQFD